MTQGWRKKATIVSLMLTAIPAFAAPVWTLSPLTPTTLALNASETATVSYQLTNQSLRTHILAVSPQAGITQVTTDGNCSNPVTLTAGQSCVLTLTVDGSAVTQPIITGPEVCEAGSRLACYQPSIANRLRITQNAGAITLAVNPVVLQLYRNQSTNVTVANTDNSRNALNVLAQFSNSALDGLVTSSTCNTITPQGSCSLSLTAGNQSVPLSPFIIQGDNTNPVNIQAAISLPLAYVASYGRTTSVCDIAADGRLSNCRDAGTQISRPSAIAITNQNAGAYVSSSINGIYHCGLDQTTGQLTNCALTYPVNNAQGIALSANNTYAYITNYNDYRVTLCAIAANGTLTGCQATGGSFNFPAGITLNQDNTRAYVVNYGSLSVCAIDATTHQLTNCQINPNVSPAFKIVLNQANTRAYTTFNINSNNTTQVCSVEAATGLLTNCVDTATTASGDFINQSFGIALNAANTYAYLANANNNTFYICEVISTDGRLVNCTTIADNLNGPYDVALAH